MRRRVAELCAAARVEALTVPAYEDLITGGSALTTLRNVELDDLVGRDPVELDKAGLAEWLGNRVVMVTGAGGSIGTELCHQIARFRPARLVLFDMSEAAIYAIQTALADAFPQLPLVSIVGDAKHATLVDEVMSREKPERRVPCRGVQARAADGGDERVAGRAQQRLRHVRDGPRGRRRPRGEIRAGLHRQGGEPDLGDGRLQALAEIVCQSMQDGGTQFVLVRFGNVFGSAGSVIPRFTEQIARGGPVTVTHPDITRFFMSSSEATQLLLQAGLQGKGGEILVLDMGEPVRIVDLARDLIRLYGADPDHIPVVFTGLRPGEKLFEEPLAPEESTKPTPHPKLRIARARDANRDAVGQMVAWCERDRPSRDAEVRARLRSWIPEYVPPAGAPIEPIPAEATGRDDGVPVPLRAPRRR